MKTLIITQEKSFKWSIGLHAGILLLGFIPFMHTVLKKTPETYLVEVGFTDPPAPIASGSQGLQAKSQVYHNEPEPTTGEMTDEPIPVEDIEPTDEIEIAEETADINSDVTASESESEVAAAETGMHGQNNETHADGGGIGSPIEGNQDGAAMAGDGGGGDGLEGDGIITRKIVYHENITSVARANGKVVLNICIDRQGKVVYAAYDPEKTSISDTGIIKEATLLATRYRFETNYSAPVKECGQLTFIFSIEDAVASK